MLNEARIVRCSTTCMSARLIHLEGCRATCLFSVFSTYPTGTSQCWISRVLIVDGQETHTSDLELINMARQKNMSHLYLPPRCSQRVQPLDVGMLKLIGAFYTKKSWNWFVNHPRRVVTVLTLLELFRDAYLHAACALTAVNDLKQLEYDQSVVMYFRMLIIRHNWQQIFLLFLLNHSHTRELKHLLEHQFSVVNAELMCWTYHHFLKCGRTVVEQLIRDLKARQLFWQTVLINRN